MTSASNRVEHDISENFFSVFVISDRVSAISINR